VNQLEQKQRGGGGWGPQRGKNVEKGNGGNPSERDVCLFGKGEGLSRIAQGKPWETRKGKMPPRGRRVNAGPAALSSEGCFLPTTRYKRKKGGSSKEKRDKKFFYLKHGWAEIPESEWSRGRINRGIAKGGNKGGKNSESQPGEALTGLGFQGQKGA